METFWKPLRQRVVLLVDGLGLEDGMVAVLQVLDVRAISLEPDSIHSLAGDGPGRAVFRRRVPQRSGVGSSCVLRAGGAVGPVGRPDEALGTVLGQDVGWFAIEGHNPTDLGRSRGGLSCVCAGYRDDRLHGQTLARRSCCW
jgi:hypothetical protein